LLDGPNRKQPVGSVERLRKPIGLLRVRGAAMGIATLHPSYALQTALFHFPHKCYISEMTTAEDIEKAVEQLAPRELARFRAWFEAFDAQRFDAAIEQNIRAGKLDAHAEEALAAHRAGRSREL
jgi:hypothetical protein